MVKELEKACNIQRTHLVGSFFMEGEIIIKTIFGYARVSTDTQCLDRQIDALKRYGVDKIYREKMSGTKKERPELSRLLSEVKDGDTIVVESLSRLGRSVKNLSELVEMFGDRNIHLVSLKESIDTKSSTGRLLFTILSSLAQFERDVLAERTKEGLKAARARGRFGGRPKISTEKISKAMALYNTRQYTAKEISEITGVSKSTLYRSIKNL